ncbi:hypothetical protein ACFOOK_30505 [Micromonospora krabiensis]|uniref:Uncharacterized protein n=1 Tax=Micromonospora krabiensis TaxID=307121 RepID=A0A1C3N314_9ACTN|nr:hypothetical protein [Micromonospora krabiensis]SBV26959.1 hypothetical protein GA0070620_2457 [Micromonospora krabiensis]
MTGTTHSHPATSTDRWPSALGLVAAGGAIAVMALGDREAALFGPSIATMAGIYLVAYALGRPWAAWLAFPALSAVVAVLHVLRARDVAALDPAVGMTVLLVPLWLWAVARRRFTEPRTVTLQTVGMLAFGAVTLLASAVQSRLAVLVAAVGFLAHGVWDAYHFRVNAVVNRPWSEFCGVVDLVVGAALVVVAVA